MTGQHIGIDDAMLVHAITGTPVALWSKYDAGQLAEMANDIAA